jgi:hypothetical protein
LSSRAIWPAACRCLDPRGRRSKRMAKFAIAELAAFDRG